MEQERPKLPNRLPSLSSAKRTREDEDNPREVNAADHQLPPRALVVDEPREQDQYLPIANIIRIMRLILPTHARISDDTKETIQECTSEYISFITQEANDQCLGENRNTVTAEDLIYALSKLGFDHYVKPLTLYLNKYREIETDKPSLRGELPAHLRWGTSSGPSDAGPSLFNVLNFNMMMNVRFGGGGGTALAGLYGCNYGLAVAGPSGGASTPIGPNGGTALAGLYGCNYGLAVAGPSGGASTPIGPNGGTTLGGLCGGNYGLAVACPSGGASAPIGMQPSQSSGRSHTTRPSPLSRGGLLGPSGGAITPGGPSGGPFGPGGMSAGPVAPPMYVMHGGITPTGAATAATTVTGTMSEGASSSSQATMSNFDHFLEFM